jgi:hypothetical protein
MTNDQLQMLGIVAGAGWAVFHQLLTTDDGRPPFCDFYLKK